MICPNRRHPGDRGFALVSALVMALIIGGLLIALQLVVREIAEEASSASDEAELRACLNAGLNRMVYAYIARDDPLRRSLVPDGRGISWSFENRKLRLEVQAESGKWDINSGDRDHVVALVRHLVPDETAQAGILDRIDRARAGGKKLTSVASVLAPLERMSDLRRVLEDHFTVATNQVGIDPLTAPTGILDAMPSLPAHERQQLLRARAEGASLPLGMIGPFMRFFVTEKPVYTFRADSGEGFRRAGAMKALVRFSENGDFSIFSWTRTSRRPSDRSHPEPQTSGALSPQ